MLLQAPKLSFFKPGELRPSGWLLRQLRIQADGLSGHLQEMWPDIRDSAWIGGNRDGWERVPYWLDGFIPMAYLLEDEKLIADAKRYINGIIERIAPDGWLCPGKPEDRGGYDMWAYLLICKVLTVYADCEPSEEKKICDILTKAFDVLSAHLDVYPLKSWGHSRWFEGLIPIYWLYERTGKDSLLELAVKLKAQGMDWDAVIADEKMKSHERKWTFETHIVNLNMVLKQGALVSRVSGDDPESFANEEIKLLDGYHSMACGAFTGDECLMGDSPIQGTELCGIVEGMYSYEHLLSISGDPCWADRLERLAFNALPAAMTADMWAHQYDQMTNQVECAPLPSDHVVFGTNGNVSHTFGVEPNFGCCTANFSQGWPKLALVPFMRSEKGIVSCVHVPSVLNTKIGNANVRIELETEYPFGDTLVYHISTDRAVNFGLRIRIPENVEMVKVDGTDKFTDVKWISFGRLWEGESTLTVELKMKTRMVRRPSGMYCVWRGPLLYSLAIDEEWERVEGERSGYSAVYPYCDYYIRPRSDWNYAFTSQSFKLRRSGISDFPFSTSEPPLTLYGEGVKIPWREEYGVCTEKPDSLEPMGQPEKIRLIPYGCTQLRMTELPLIMD